MRSFQHNKFRLCIVDLLSCVSDCERDILRDLDRYNLIECQNVNFRKRDVRTVFYYFILKQICDVMLRSRSSNKYVFFYNRKCVTHNQFKFFDMCNTNKYKFSDFLATMVNKINNILPTPIYITQDICYDDLADDVQDNVDIMYDIRNVVENKCNKTFTFEKSKKFVKQYGLTYLDTEYFNKVKIKCLLYK